MTNQKKHLYKLKELKERTFTIQKPPRLLLLQEKQLSMIDEKSFVYSKEYNKDIYKINKRILKNINNPVFCLENLKPVVKEVTANTIQNIEEYDESNSSTKSSEEEHPSSKGRKQNPKLSKSKKRQTKNILKQSMIERAKRGEVEHCSTKELTVYEVEERKT